jgi:uncharacterized RDD family membrane protein YckC
MEIFVSDFGAPPQPSHGYSQGPAMPAPAGQPAGLGVRFLARLLDGLILGIPFGLLLAVLVGPAMAAALKIDPVTGAVADPTALSSAMATSFMLEGAFGLIFVVYEVALIALRGATLGKQIMKLQVISTETGGAPGFGPSLLRWLIPLVGVFACVIGQLVVYISPAFDSTGLQQGWHDKVAKTRVIKL